MERPGPNSAATMWRELNQLITALNGLKNSPGGSVDGMAEDIEVLYNDLSTHLSDLYFRLNVLQENVAAAANIRRVPDQVFKDWRALYDVVNPLANPETWSPFRPNEAAYLVWCKVSFIKGKYHLERILLEGLGHAQFPPRSGNSCPQTKAT